MLQSLEEIHHCSAAVGPSPSRDRVDGNNPKRAGRCLVMRSQLLAFAVAERHLVRDITMGGVH